MPNRTVANVENWGVKSAASRLKVKVDLLGTKVEEESSAPETSTLGVDLRFAFKLSAASCNDFVFTVSLVDEFMVCESFAALDLIS